MAYEQLKLENQVCFPLYACSRKIVKLYKPFLDEIGLTYTQYITMMVMWDRSSITAKELGDILYLDSGTLTPLLKRLEKGGLINRQRGTDDERNLVITITGKGMDLKEEAQAIPAKLRECVDLPDHKLIELHSLLHEILGKKEL